MHFCVKKIIKVHTKKWKSYRLITTQLLYAHDKWVWEFGESISLKLHNPF